MDLGVFKSGEELEGFCEEESTVRYIVLKDLFTIKS